MRDPSRMEVAGGPSYRGGNRMPGEPRRRRVLQQLSASQAVKKTPPSKPPQRGEGFNTIPSPLCGPAIDDRGWAFEGGLQSYPLPPLWGRVGWGGYVQRKWKKTRQAAQPRQSFSMRAATAAC